MALTTRQPPTCHPCPVRITVRVRPQAGRTAVGGSHDGALIVRVVQATVDGKATAAMLRCLAEEFDVAREDVVLVSGSRNRTKIIDVAGGSDETLRELLAR
jgi:uncharacterized protein (TIGR00251 family)